MRGRLRWGPAARVATVYLAFSIAWILVSDRLTSALIADPDAQSRFQSVKGLGFVLVTSGVLYLVSHRYLDRVRDTALNLEHAYDETLNGWAAALDLRDRSTAQHTARVTQLTVALAKRMRVDPADLEHIRRGATLHDIGKMGVPDSILTKPAALDADEWRQMRMHPDLAVEMLRGIAYLSPALVIPWCHHEKWDGSGYPRGLSGEQIPQEARLFAVIDVYDAVTSVRPYREPMSHPDAIALIQQGSGSHFDPEVVQAFCAMLHDGDLAAQV